MWTRFVLAFALALTPAFAEGPSAEVIVQRAIDLKAEVDKANQTDLKWLWEKVQAKFQSLSEQEKRNFLEGLRSSLSKERDSLVQAKAELATAKLGTPDLTTSLGKLIGTAERSGILQDAVALIPEKSEGNVLYQNFDTLKPTHNRITVLKTLLLFAWAELELALSLDDLAETQDPKNLQLAYPAPIPEEGKGPFRGCLLYCERSGKLLVPNAGYIFGGDLIEGKCRGIDCSAYQCYCARSSNRLSTMVMEYAWRDLHDGGEKAFDEAELKIREELLANWGLKEAREEFEAIEVAEENLKPGDIVVWRTPAVKSKTGHTVMYLGPSATQGLFVGIEANRYDDKSQEGFLTNSFSLKKENAATYLLRRRQ